MRSNRIIVSRIFLYFISILICIIILFPVAILVISSLKTNREIMMNPLAFPKVFSLKNFKAAWEGAQISRYFLNSLIYCVCAVFATVFSAAAASFAFAKIRLKATALFYPLLLSGTTIPVISIIVPLYFIIAGLHLINTVTGIVLVYTTISLPFAIMIMTASMKGIPDELIESAIMDGASLGGIFFRIILPLSRTTMITVGIITFVKLWNDFLISLILTQKSRFYTLAVGLKAFVGEHSIQYNTLSAGLLLAIIPPILVYFFLQEQIVEGMMAGAVKG